MISKFNLQTTSIAAKRSRILSLHDISGKQFQSAIALSIKSFGMNIGWIIGGLVLLEYSFNIYGMGQLFLSAITNRDYFLISTLFIFITGVVLFVNYITDVLYVLIEPTQHFNKINFNKLFL